MQAFGLVGQSLPVGTDGPGGAKLRGCLALAVRSSQVLLDRVISQIVQPFLGLPAALALVEHKLLAGVARDLDRNQGAACSHVVFGALGRLDEFHSVLSRVLEPDRVWLIHAALEFVARARSHLPLDDQVARLDLKEPRAFLHVFCTALDRQTAFQAKGHSGAGAVGQRIDNALAKKTTLAEKGERPALEQAAGLVGEARDPERMRSRIRHAAKDAKPNQARRYRGRKGRWLRLALLCLPAGAWSRGCQGP